MESSIRGFREVKRVEAFFFSEHFSHRTAHICPSNVNADLKLIDIDPGEFNLRAIGHMGYFRRGSEELWNLVFEDLEKLNA